MTIEEQVTAAPNVRDALIIIAGALDTLLEPSGDAMTTAWEEWYQPGIPSVDNTAVITSDEDTTEVRFARPSDEKMEQRRLFERQSLKLSEYLGTDEDWNEAYALGGPLWVYLANRELVMSMPDNVKAAMVQDVDEDSHQDAAEMGRDILKRPSETGPGSSGMHVADGMIG